MIRSRRHFCLGLTAAATSFAVSGGPRSAAWGRAADQIMVGVANNVFANLFNGHPTGILIESIDLILKEMGRNPVYVVMPGSEIAAGMRDGSVAVNSVAVETAGNQSQALFSDPIVTEYNVIAILASKKLSVERLSDLHGLTLGGREGYQYPLLDKDPEISLHRFSQDGELIRNLILGRLDAAVISALSDVYKLRAEGVMPRIKLLDKSVGMVPLRAGLSPRLFNADDLDHFNHYLADLKASPAWTSILDKNGFADLIQDWPMVSQ